MRDFLESDCVDGVIYADKSELVFDAKAKTGSPTGYGGKLNTGYKIRFNGLMYRVYCTIYSNNGTCWFTANGKRITVR